MKCKPLISIVIASVSINACSSPSESAQKAEAKVVIEEKTPHELCDIEIASLAEKASLGGFDTTLFIDHGRWANEAGVKQMGASQVLFFSNPAVNVQLVQENPLAALDLPYRVLVYQVPESSSIEYAFIGADNFKNRHEISNQEALDMYAKDLAFLTSDIPETQISPIATDKLKNGFGIVHLISDLPFAETLVSIKNIVMSQGDTKWFGTYDFKAEAEGFNVQIPNETLLMFGGPGPGGVAMAQFPKLGLDAFCQKMLVYEDADGIVHVAFNDIAGFADLHYNSHIKPHELLNERIGATMQKAITAES